MCPTETLSYYCGFVTQSAFEKIGTDGGDDFFLGRISWVEGHRYDFTSLRGISSVVKG